MSKITAQTKICMIIGDPVEHSLSPQMHNAAYESLEIDTQFVYVACQVNVLDIADFVKGIRAMHVRGITCTIPHKVAIMEFLDDIDETAKKIGAVNTVVNENGILKGYNTDWIGVADPLKQVTNLSNKKVAIIGAGGFAHAAVYACVENGAQVKIYNRTQEKAQEIAEKFGCGYGSLSELPEVKTADIVINATSVGLDADESPVAKEFLKKEHIVFDAVYSPFETKLLRDAKETGATIIHGTELLLHQGFAQFEKFTGKKAPTDVMRNIVMQSIKL